MYKEPWIITSWFNNAWILDFDFFLLENEEKTRASCWIMMVNFVFCVFDFFCLVVLFLFWLINLLTMVKFVWLEINQQYLLIWSCLYHPLMSSSHTYLLLAAVMTSSSLTSLINSLIVCLMTADLLYSSLNFRSHFSFEGSYPGSYYLGSLNLSQYIIFLFMIPSYNPWI